MEPMTEIARAALNELAEKYGAHNPAPYGTIGGQPVDGRGLQPGLRTVPPAIPAGTDENAKDEKA